MASNLPNGDPTFDLVYAQTDGSPITAGSTITFQYPTVSMPANPYAPLLAPASTRLRSSAEYVADGSAKLSIPAIQAVLSEGPDFSVAYNPSNIVVTYLAGTPIPTASRVALQATLRDDDQEWKSD